MSTNIPTDNEEIIDSVDYACRLLEDIKKLLEERLPK